MPLLKATQTLYFNLYQDPHEHNDTKIRNISCRAD